MSGFEEGQLSAGGVGDEGLVSDLIEVYAIKTVEDDPA